MVTYRRREERGKETRREARLLKMYVPCIMGFKGQKNLIFFLKGKSENSDFETM